MEQYLIGIGAQRAGTTLLYRLLSQHHQIDKSIKEIHYFDKTKNVKLEEYLAKFEGKKDIKLDITPIYMFYPDCLIKMARILPIERTKIIVLLRNPIIRAQSHYYKTKRMGFEKLSFKDAFLYERERMAKNDFGYREYSYFERGKYFKQVKRALDIFPDKNVKVFVFEDFIQHQQGVINDICDFLLLEKMEIKSLHANESYDSSFRFFNRYIVFNKDRIKAHIPEQFYHPLSIVFKKAKEVNTKKLVKEEIDRNFYKQLIDYYLDDVKNLCSLINVNLVDRWKMKDI